MPGSIAMHFSPGEHLHFGDDRDFGDFGDDDNSMWQLGEKYGKAFL